MHHLRFFRASSFACALALSILFSGSFAHAAIEKVRVDETRVSGVDGYDTTALIVYGGVAGTCDSSVASATNATCSSCRPTTGTGDTALLPCNDRRINPNLQVTFTFDSTTATGYPILAVVGANGSTNVIPVVTSSGPTSQKGTTVSVTVLWSSICAVLPLGTSSSFATGCSLTTPPTALAYAHFWVGFGVASGALATTDDHQDFTIMLANGDTTGTPGSLANSANGLTHFEFKSGDSLGEIRALTRSANFPTGTGIGYRWVRAIFEKRTDKTIPVWSNITSGSPHVDLEVQGATTTQTDTTLSPIRVTGGTGQRNDGTGYTVPLENDAVYDFKTAVVDRAGNASYFTASTDDNSATTTCNAGNAAKSPPPPYGSGTYECHTVRPSEVAGILANKTNCFVATAAYGSPMASEVNAFRRFRDIYLIPTKLGKQFVLFYYREGPKAARFIAQSETLRAVSRGLLWLPLQFAKFSVAHGIVAGLLGLAASIVALCFAGFFILNLRRRRRSTECA